MSVSTLQLAADAYSMGAGRLASALAAVIGLAGAVLGGLAGRGRSWAGRNGSLVALVAGPLAVVVGALVVVTAEGGLGTGNGLGGGVVAMIFGLLSTGLGWRARRVASRAV
ncbi:DUF6223 family protein [Streptomyces tritici]|uniref:DUF6223 family protein n=1 Tax=Streptomyces tritici TaxID=2054410 RepID=UPI003AF0980F